MPATPEKNKYIRAGLELLAEAGDMSSLLTIEKIAERAGVSAQAFNNYWKSRGSKAGFMQELLKAVLTFDRFRAIASIVGMIDELRQIENLVEGIEAVSREDFRTCVMDDNNSALFLVIGGRPDRDVSKAARRLYEDFDDLLIPPIEAVMEARDIEPTPPFTAKSIAIVLNALVDGFALRARIDPNAGLEDIYVNTILSLLVMVTRRKGDTTTLAAKVSILNNRPDAH
jgi:AcrR family transcriptional regulator